ncbi:MAG TPA: ROK family protein [Flavobacteriaceae bacterium]
MQEYLGVDLGGTNFKAGRVKDGAIISEAYNSVHRDSSKSELIQTLFKTIDEVITENVKGIGVGVPGIVDSVSGVIYDILNLPMWKEVPLQNLLEQRYGLPVFLNNDANCFVKGEKIYGKGTSYSNFVGLSIGTGLGMGVIINDQLYTGVMCGAGEIGMVIYKDSIIEHYASSLFFERKYNQNAKEMSILAKKGDVTALKAFSEFGEHLGNAIINILYMYAPEAIVMGGSISKSYALFKGPMEETLKSFAYTKQLERLKIEVSTLSGIAILGAAALCVE